MEKSFASLRAVRVKAILFVALAAALFALPYLCGRSLTLENLSGLVASKPALAPAVYVAVVALLPAVGAPRLILTAAGGAAFGAAKGAALALAGSLMAAVLGYFLAYISVSEYVECRSGLEAGFKKALGFARENDFMLIFAGRICPLFHCELINYLCGSARIRFSTFLSATFFGDVPGAVVYAIMGESVIRIDSRYGFFGAVASLSPEFIEKNPDVRNFIIANVLLAVLLIVSLWIFYRASARAGRAA